jgi:hypothetical protein
MDVARKFRGLGIAEDGAGGWFNSCASELESSRASLLGKGRPVRYGVATLLFGALALADVATDALQFNTVSVCLNYVVGPLLPSRFTIWQDDLELVCFDPWILDSEAM